MPPQQQSRWLHRMVSCIKRFVKPKLSNRQTKRRSRPECSPSLSRYLDDQDSSIFSLDSREGSNTTDSLINSRRLGDFDVPRTPMTPRSFRGSAGSGFLSRQQGDYSSYYRRGSMERPFGLHPFIEDNVMILDDDDCTERARNVPIGPDEGSTSDGYVMAPPPHRCLAHPATDAGNNAAAAAAEWRNNSTTLDVPTASSSPFQLVPSTLSVDISSTALNDRPSAASLINAEELRRFAKPSGKANNINTTNNRNNNNNNSNARSSPSIEPANSTEEETRDSWQTAMSRPSPKLSATVPTAITCNRSTPNKGATVRLQDAKAIPIDIYLDEAEWNVGLFRPDEDN